MSTLALLGLGSNLGDRKAILDEAVAALNEGPGITVRGMSAYHETRAVGGPPGQGPFLNAAVSLETTIDALALLRRLQEIETRAGRVRTVRWGERTLDLDLLLFGEEIIDTPELTVPHPRIGVRRFVLAPLAEIAPETKDPLSGCPISELRSNLDRRPSCLALKGWWEEPASSAGYEHIVQELDGIGLSLRQNLQLGDRYDPLLPAELEPHDLLKQIVEWLDPRQWYALGSRWLITDFHLHEIVINAAEHWSEEFEGPFWPFVHCLEEREASVIKPTFVVHRSIPGSSPFEGYTSRGTVCLRLECNTVDEEISEILHACAATRN